MKEINTFSFFFSADQFHGQFIILFEDARNVLPADRILLILGRNNRLNGNLLKAQIRQMHHIRGKIQIVSRKCSAHIIVCLIPALRKLPVFRNDNVVAALSAAERSHPVMNFLPAVDAEHHICHLFVDKLLHLII